MSKAIIHGDYTSNYLTPQLFSLDSSSIVKDTKLECCYKCFQGFIQFLDEALTSALLEHNVHLCNNVSEK